MHFESFDASALENSKSLISKKLMRRNSAKSLQENKVQVLVLGKQSVGKTTLIQKFTREKTSGNTNEVNNRLGVDIVVELTELNENIDDKKRKLEIESAHAYIVMYSAPNRQTYESVPDYIEEIINVRGPGMPIVLVQNKVDISTKGLWHSNSVCIKEELIPHVNTSIKEELNLHLVHKKLFEHQTLMKLSDIVLKINSCEVLADLSRLLQQADSVEKRVSSIFSNKSTIPRSRPSRFSLF